MVTSETKAADPAGLTRSRLVEAALQLAQDDGVDSVTMRALAERLEVKAASLYWHVRDRGELLELMAAAILARVPARPAAPGWRQSALQVCEDVADVVSKQRDAARIVLLDTASMERSASHEELTRLFAGAGLGAGEADAVATMLLAHVVMNPRLPTEKTTYEPGRPASLHVDSGSRGVAARAGAAMDTLVRVPHDAKAAAPTVIRGEVVIVRRLRGTGHAEIELNPANPWSFQIQGPTWNTRLELRGIDVRELKLDSGAARVECFLPAPRGVVPIKVSGGTVDVKLHRPPGVPVAATIKSGAVKVKLDDFSLVAAVGDARWTSGPIAESAPHYELEISGGAVRVTADEIGEQLPPSTAGANTSVLPAAVDPSDAIQVLLDGVDARVRRRS